MNYIKRVDWILYLLWALFINMCNIWLIGPLVEDYSILGVISLFVILGIWLISIPPKWRKKWITFTLFAIMLGTGYSSLSYYPTGHRVVLTIVISVLLIVLAAWVGKVRILSLVFGALVLIAGNWWLPFSDWTFLSHFSVAYYGKLGLNPADMPSLPVVPVPTSNGKNVLITLSLMPETTQDVQTSVAAAGSTPNSLHDVIQSFDHRYEVMEITYQNGKFVRVPAKPSDIARLNPIDLVSTFFPMEEARWSVENGKVIQYTVPTITAQQYAQISNDAANYPSNALAMAEQVQEANMRNWDELLAKLGITPTHQLSVANGILHGTWNGHDIHVAVNSTALVATGSFTSPNAQQALLEGANRLQIVDLNSGSGKLVSTYVGSATSPVSSDIRVGAIDNSGREAIFVNDAPAFILQASAHGPWKTLYTAPPNSSLRFEGSAVWGSDKTPEIITDDPSLLRPTPTRFLTSYTYRDGQLYRNWRVYHTNVVNVYPVRFQPNGKMYLAFTIYNQGKFFILSRQFIPVVPITASLLGLSVLIGFILRMRMGGQKRAESKS